MLTKYPLQYSCAKKNNCNIVDKTVKLENKLDYIQSKLIRTKSHCSIQKKIHYMDTIAYIQSMNLKHLCA